MKLYNGLVLIFVIYCGTLPTDLLIPGHSSNVWPVDSVASKEESYPHVLLMSAGGKPAPNPCGKFKL